MKYERNYTYVWPGDFTVDQLSMILQEPAEALNISVQPKGAGFCSQCGAQQASGDRFCSKCARHWGKIDKFSTGRLMTVILITTLSILAITGVAWLAGEILPFSFSFSICPICVGVAGTWLWMLAGRLAGFEIDASMFAILLGGSVVGIGDQLEKHLPQGRSPLLWKTLFLPAGFVAAYGLIVPHWSLLGIAVVALALLMAVFFVPRRQPEKNNAVVEKLKEDMKKCC